MAMLVQKKPLVSILIVNYNGRELIVNCLKALEEQSFKDFEIVIIDNGSTDESLNVIGNFLKTSFLSSLMKLIPLDRNAGFTGGSLEGLKYACGQYIALLNNDAEPEGKWLVELVKAMVEDPSSGICASKMIVHGTDIIDSAGDGFSTALKGFVEGERQKSLSYNEKRYVFGACGGAALCRRKMIDQIGFLDEDFFLIHEDIDLNFRAQLNGWKALYVPAAIVYHKVRSSIGHMSDTAVYYTLRNSEFVRIKNVPLPIFIRCLPEYVIWSLMEFAYFVIKHKKLKLYFKAKADAIRMLPEMLKKRARIMKNRTVSNRYLLSMMTPLWQKDLLLSKIKKFFYA
jgi:GT2 family glycosyltransferase